MRNLRGHQSLVRLTAIALISGALTLAVMARATTSGKSGPTRSTATPTAAATTTPSTSTTPTSTSSSTPTPTAVTLAPVPNFSPTSRISRPIPFGVSGGNINDRTTTTCNGGTLGGLLVRSGVQYILSNNHVLAKTNTGKGGDAIVQPALIDTACKQISGDAVANLTSFVKIGFKTSSTTPLNKVDAAVARVASGAVRTDGAINGIGPVSNLTAQDQVGCPVQKSGRSTGVTKGKITAIDATVDVTYSNGQVARFVDQFIVGSGFSAAGDSGSLVVRDDPYTTTPRVVGLLFAGNSSISIVNPISNVLGALSGYSVAGKDDGRSTGCPVQSATSSGGSYSVGSTSATAESSGVNQRIERARAAKEKHADRLLAMRNVVGVGVGIAGTVDVLMSNDDTETLSQMPAEFDGVPAQMLVVGEILAR